MTNAKVWVYLDPCIYLDHRTVMGKQVPDDLLDQLALSEAGGMSRIVNDIV
jgi:hypothetical protein